MNTPGRDRGDIVLGWLTKLTLVLSVLGLVLFDAVSVGAAHFQAADAAALAAREAAEEHRSSGNLQKAYDAAYAEVVDEGDTIGTTDFAVAPDGRVTLTLTRTAPTLVLRRISPLERFTRVSATATGTASS